MNTTPTIEYFSNHGEIFFTTPSGVFPFAELPCSAATALRAELEVIAKAITKIENETDPFMQLRMFAQLKAAVHTHTTAPYGTITARELEIARLLPGRTDKEIATTLGISQNTVISHISHLLQKLGEHTRSAIVKWSMCSNLL